MSIFPIRALTEKVLINMPKAIFPPSKNTYISQYYPLQNFNRSVSLFAGQFKQSGDAYRSLLKFDINNISTDGNLIPTRSIIDEAYLQLAIKRNEVPEESSILLNIFAVLQPWTSETVNWNQQPLIHAVSESGATIESGYYTVELNLTSLVRDWFTKNIYNHGILLIGDESRNSLTAFYSSFSRDSNLWPRLIIKYSYS